MRTAAIPYRVADFLKQHPPFQGMAEADLVVLAGKGRVKFHEPDEYLCWQGAAFGQFVFVIQQGSVTLWDESAEPPVLRDIRGAGDVVGLERFHGEERCLYSAKAASEVVVYALHAVDFGGLVETYAEARQYVAAHTAVTAGFQAQNGKPPAHEIPVETLADREADVACLKSTTIREAARMLAASGDSADGSPGSPIEAVVSAARLGSAFGEQPLEILRAVERARNLKELATLQSRARGWIQEGLAPGGMEWLAAFGDELNRRMLERAARVSGLVKEGAVWCFAGAAGRKELLTGEAPKVAVIGRAPGGLAEILGECGFLGATEVQAGSLEEWRERFTGWIRDPILKQVYLAREVFDLRAIWGRTEAFEELASHVRAELAREPGFLRILAKDCLGNLPPLTFLRDVVVEDSGVRTDTSRLKSSALMPLVDVARVFSRAAHGA